MRLRERGRSRINEKRYPGRNLFKMPSVFYRKAETHRHRRPDRAFPQKIRKVSEKRDQRPVNTDVVSPPESGTPPGHRPAGTTCRAHRTASRFTGERPHLKRICVNFKPRSTRRAGIHTFPQRAYDGRTVVCADFVLFVVSYMGLSDCTDRFQPGCRTGSVRAEVTS